MTLFAYSRPGVDGRDAAILGTLEFALVNREEIDGRIRTTAKWSARLEPQQLTETDPVTGEESTFWAGVAEVLLPTTGIAQGVRVNENLIPTAGAQAYVVAVPASPPALAVDLPRLDPATLEQSEDLATAWDSIVGEIRALRGETVTARDDTDQARVAANEAATAAAQSRADASQQAADASDAGAQAEQARAAAVEKAAEAAQSASQAARAADESADAAAGVAQLQADLGGLVFAADSTDGDSVLLLESGGVSAPSADVVEIDVAIGGTLQVPRLDAGTVSALRLGGHFLWVDSVGKLRVSGTAPTSDTAGTVVGSQS